MPLLKGEEGANGPRLRGDDDVNETMKGYLVQAAQERAVRVRGRPLNEHQLKIVINASLRMKENGFDQRTLWRALELATDAEVATT